MLMFFIEMYRKFLAEPSQNIQRKGEISTEFCSGDAKKPESSPRAPENAQEPQDTRIQPKGHFLEKFLALPPGSWIA